ncbi:MAG: hypothetical protein ACYTG0_14205 [Planctomycetota bacterium]|jgi:hypothetical protein
MPRPVRQESQPPGYDSFLDVVANIVGILIILVMVTGLRVRNATVEAASDEGIQTELVALRKERGSANSLRREVFELAAQIRNLDRARMARQIERDRLAIAVAAWEHRLQSHRDQLTAEEQAIYNARLGLDEADSRLDELRREREYVESARAAPIRVESYPTPLSKIVDGEEGHFQLRAGRITYIPLERLLEAFQEQARQRAYKLFQQPELTDTVGPEGGFRLRYTLERREVAQETRDGRIRMGTYARLTRWTLIPVSGQLGESAETALSEGSQFRAVLSRLDPGQATITIWTYPDSFAEFRRLKKELFHLGFATAARPLPDGVRISGSPEGSKSAAE